MTTQTTPALDEPFDAGPPRRLETALRLVKSDKRTTIPGAVLISMIVWAALVLLNVTLPDLPQLLLLDPLLGGKAK